MPVNDNLLPIESREFEKSKHSHEGNARWILHYHIVVVLTLENEDELNDLDEDTKDCVKQVKCFRKSL
jgi:hypothetical protein